MNTHPIIQVNRLRLPVYDNDLAVVAWSPEYESAGVVAAVVDLPDRVETLVVGLASRGPNGRVRLRDIDIRSMHDERPVDTSSHLPFAPSTMMAFLEIAQLWPWLSGSYGIDGTDMLFDAVTGKRAESANNETSTVAA